MEQILPSIVVLIDFNVIFLRVYVYGTILNFVLVLISTCRILS